MDMFEDQQTCSEGPHLVDLVTHFENSPHLQNVQTHQYKILQDLYQLVMQQLEYPHFQLTVFLCCGTHPTEHN